MRRHGDDKRDKRKEHPGIEGDLQNSDNRISGEYIQFAQRVGALLEQQLCTRVGQDGEKNKWYVIHNEIPFLSSCHKYK
ncbi:MAG: hypothetical protein MnENMB40S_24130 [Rhizobiaceae bacterium MnEN-MB40S]|nr:MAG: hypothetical protein MnENMB40S_24130 [Rhizobiaceae bacterium MnEN-MB40S]